MAIIIERKNYYPICFIIGEDGTLLKSNALDGALFNYSELQQLHDAIITTLDYYEKRQFVDDAEIDDYNEIQHYLRTKNLQSIPRLEAFAELNRQFNTNVYLMVDHNTGYYKIGRSNNAAKREKTLQSEKPTIEMLHTFKARSKDETYFHELFKKQRIRGEWFNLSKDDIDTIVSYFKKLDINRQRREQL